MPITELKGDIFKSEAIAICNTCNCVGAMGRGIALAFRARYPEMFRIYRARCVRGELRPGMVLPYTRSYKRGEGPVVFNLLVKDHWRQPSRHEWVREVCKRVAVEYDAFGVTSLALPHVGRLNGWIDWPTSRAIIYEVLDPLPIPVELIEYAPELTENVVVSAPR